VLDITESSLMQDSEATIDRLDRLKALGVRLAVDDFGTGYSSLDYLRRFPIDILKIDRSFITWVDGDVKESTLCRAIVALGNNLGMQTLAEGIETNGQLGALRTLGPSVISLVSLPGSGACRVWAAVRGWAGRTAAAPPKVRYVRHTERVTCRGVPTARVSRSDAARLPPAAPGP